MPAGEKTNMASKLNEKVYIGKTHRFIVEQTVGFSKVLSQLEKAFKLDVLRTQDEEIILIEEKEKVEEM